MPGLQLALIDSNRFMVHQAGTQKQICSASRKHSIMKNPNCSILKRMDTASSCLQGRSLTRWKRESTLLAIKCRLAEMVHPMNGLNNCKTVSTATLHRKTKCLPFSGHQLGWRCLQKKRSAQSASRGKAKSDVGGNEVSLEAAFGSRTKAANFSHMSSL